MIIMNISHIYVHYFHSLHCENTNTASSLATWIVYFSLGCIDINERKRLDNTCDIVTSNFLLLFKDLLRAIELYIYVFETNKTKIRNIRIHVQQYVKYWNTFYNILITNNLCLEYIEKLRTYNVECVHWKTNETVLYINLHLLQQWTLNRGKHSFFFFF